MGQAFWASGLWLKTNETQFRTEGYQVLCFIHVQSSCVLAFTKSAASKNRTEDKERAWLHDSEERIPQKMGVLRIAWGIAQQSCH